MLTPISCFPIARAERLLERILETFEHRPQALASEPVPYGLGKQGGMNSDGHDSAPCRYHTLFTMDGAKSVLSYGCAFLSKVERTLPSSIL